MLKSSLDVLRKEKGTIVNLSESCVGTERNCCKIVIIGIKREYISHCHFSWRMTVLGGKQFLKKGYPEAIVKAVFFCFCLFLFSRFSSILTGRKGGASPPPFPGL